MELLKKITMREVSNLAVKEIKEIASKAGNGVDVLLCRFLGIATSARQKTSNYGEYVQFLGNFEGINALTGGKFRAPYCILPQIAEGVLWNAINEAQGAPVTFALDIGVKCDEKAATGYVYYCKPVLTNENDPLSAIAQMALDKLALPPVAPVVEEVKPEPDAEGANKKK